MFLMVVEPIFSRMFGDGEQFLLSEPKGHEGKIAPKEPQPHVSQTAIDAAITGKQFNKAELTIRIGIARSKDGLDCRTKIMNT